MIVVIDTNAVLIMFKLTMFKPSHPGHILFRVWSTGRFVWAVTTEIVLEYEEIMTRLVSAAYAAQAMSTVSRIGLLRPGSLLQLSPSFRFHTITNDPDDDKFADCAIAAHADYHYQRQALQRAHRQRLQASAGRPAPGNRVSQ